MGFFPRNTRLGKTERKIELSKKRASEAASRRFSEKQSIKRLEEAKATCS